MRLRGKLFVLVVGVVLFAALPAGAAPMPTNIHIASNDDFDLAHGVRSGRGTKADPYVISGLELQRLHIENTSKYVNIHSNTVAGQMVLDWIGDRAKVHYNRIGDLRVNRNVPRTGLPTSGSIVHNSFGIVGQLRHWDGLFAHNRVGSRDALTARAVNFDGFNGAHFMHNKIYGFMDARLHGHHHSSQFGEPSHMHAGHHSHEMDHSHRYHQVAITHNAIYANHEYALAYLDTGHAGNDRTAASETEKSLNDPHIHFTRMYLDSNRLVGAGIRIDVFNAQDAHHTKTSRGLAAVRWNDVFLARDDFFSGRNLHGIEVRNARDISLRIEGNLIRGKDVKKGNMLAFLENWDKHAGVFLHNVDDGSILVARNRVENRVYGVRAEAFTPRVRWKVDDLVTKNVDDAVYYQNVPNKPA
jgi:hypothetical protein